MTSMLRRVKSRKGFTLTELIVVVAIVALLMICVTAFVGPINTMVKNTTADADAITINEIAGDYIERRLAYADCIQIYLGANADTTNITARITARTFFAIFISFFLRTNKNFYYKGIRPIT